MPLTTARLVWRLTGSDPLGFLDATTTQDHAGQAVGETRWCCVLDPHGRVIAFLRSIPVDDGSVLLDGEPACDEGIAWLRSIAPLSRCSIQDEPQLAVIATKDETDDSAVARSVRSDGLPGVDLIAARGTAEPAGAEGEADRIARGWPRYGVDVTSEQVINDTPLLALCVSFTKGCYRGQETVAKIHNLGHARRGYVRLRALEPGSSLDSGATIRVDDVDSGTVTSAATVGDTGTAIGVVRREHRAASSAEVGGQAASIEPLEIAEEPTGPPKPQAPTRRNRTFGRR